MRPNTLRSRWVNGPCGVVGRRKILNRTLDAQTTRKPRGNSLVQPPQRVNVSSIAGISIVATTTSSGSWQRSQISIV
jgi:hypothetical protein